jgi:hypothetical protein
MKIAILNYRRGDKAKGDKARGEKIDTPEIEKVLLEYTEWLYE